MDRRHGVRLAETQVPQGRGFRLLPGVVGNAESLVEESHEGGLLEYPIYTKPAVWDGGDGVERTVPEVLLGGNHAAIAQWRHEQRLARTAARLLLFVAVLLLVTVAATLVWGLAGLTTVALIATVVVFGLLTAYAAGF